MKRDFRPRRFKTPRYPVLAQAGRILRREVIAISAVILGAAGLAACSRDIVTDERDTTVIDSGLHPDAGSPDVDHGDTAGIADVGTVLDGGQADQGSEDSGVEQRDATAGIDIGRPPNG